MIPSLETPTFISISTPVEPTVWRGLHFGVSVVPGTSVPCLKYSGDAFSVVVHRAKAQDTARKVHTCWCASIDAGESSWVGYGRHEAGPAEALDEALRLLREDHESTGRVLTQCGG